MDLSKSLLDLILVPLSLCVTIGYHVYLWHSFTRGKHPNTSGTCLNLTRRRAWLRKISQDKEKGGGILAVQSFRNSLMSATLCATVAIIVYSSLAALTNNAYNASDDLRRPIFGIQTGPVLVLKYATSSLLMLSSFVCCSLAVGCINEANFLLNSAELYQEYAKAMLKRGCLLATVGNRVLFLTLPFLMWLFGPVPMAVSAAAMIWVLFNLDFVDDRKLRMTMLSSGR